MTAADASFSLDLSSLARTLAAEGGSASSIARLVLERAQGTGTEAIWIHRRPPRVVLAEAGELDQRRAAGERLPLFGVPFAVKDNIDVEGLPTTAACPAFAYPATTSAPVVRRLQQAGALLIGKTNLDQFATGLVGTRSPYGIPGNPFDGRYIVGGSSSGSAAAVARGLVSFALGTDTAGSGRVPAAFTNLVGIKPSRGLISTRGVVPACRSLDCVSVFALTVEDAAAVAAAAAGFDEQDPGSHPQAGPGSWDLGAASLPASFRFGVPRPADREFFGDAEAERLFDGAVARLQSLGGEPVPVDLTPFLEAAHLLYDGPWIAERLSDLAAFLERAPEALLPVTRQILEEGRSHGGVQVFDGLHRLAALQRQVSLVWRDIETLLLPTTPTIYTIAQIAAEPRALNARLGRYTNFVNLLDLAAVAVPAGLRGDGLPAGVTLVGPWGSDARLAGRASRLHQALGGTLGATGVPLPAVTPAQRPAAPTTMRLAVVGAHLSGEPLNHQLTELGARLLRATRTAPCYRLYALASTPAKPGLLHVPEGEGSEIAVEVWELPVAAFGTFFRAVAPPLAIGTVELADGERVPGFVCEAYAVAGTRDITRFGGWKSFRAAPAEDSG
jgi:allophanate hydrolase